MSGGSFDYLCLKDADEFVLDDNVELIKKITESLQEYDNIDDVLKLTNIIFDNINTMKKDIATLNENLLKIKGVWRAIEWCSDGDVAKDRIIYEIDEFNRCEEVRNKNMINLLKDLNITKIYK